MRLSRLSLVAAMTAGLSVAAAGPAAAHEAWFVHHPERYPLDWAALSAAPR